MSIYVNIISVLLGFCFIIFIFRQMIRKRINEQQSILWILIGFCLVVLGLWPHLLGFIAEKLGIWYPPAILFALAFVGLLGIVIHHTITISVLHNKVHELSMQLALLKQEIEHIQQIKKDI